MWRKRVPGSRNYFSLFQPQMHKIWDSKLRITILLVRDNKKNKRQKYYKLETRVDRVILIF
jgi:hypothetical protein